MDIRDKAMQLFLGCEVSVTVDRPLGYCHNTTVYPINYGYIPGVSGGDGQDQDVYILGVSEPISRFEGWIIGAIRRINDCEDKLIAAPKGVLYHQAEMEEAVHFQEQYFDHYIIPLFHKSCGVIPYRLNGTEREYLIVFEQFSKCWSLPKGHMEPGETEQQTALRELKEETGLSAVLDSNRCVTIEYPLCPIGQKQVVLFLGEVSGIPKIRPGEIEKFRWVSKEMLSSFLHPDTWDACKKLL